MLKLVTPREKLIGHMKMGWAEDLTAPQIRQIAFAELLGAVGLVVPWLTHIEPRLTPVAALCLFILMLGATFTHVSRHESPVASSVFGLAALFVAVGRFYLVT
jgi:hypothetical protein